MNKQTGRFIACCCCGSSWVEIIKETPQLIDHQRELKQSEYRRQSQLLLSQIKNEI